MDIETAVDPLDETPADSAGTRLSLALLRNAREAARLAAIGLRVPRTLEAINRGLMDIAATMRAGG